MIKGVDFNILKQELMSLIYGRIRYNNELSEFLLDKEITLEQKQEELLSNFPALTEHLSQFDTDLKRHAFIDFLIKRFEKWNDYLEEHYLQMIPLIDDISSLSLFYANLIVEKEMLANDADLHEDGPSKKTLSYFEFIKFVQSSIREHLTPLEINFIDVMDNMAISFDSESSIFTLSGKCDITELPFNSKLLSELRHFQDTANLLLAPYVDHTVNQKQWLGKLNAKEEAQLAINNRILSFINKYNDGKQIINNYLMPNSKQSPLCVSLYDKDLSNIYNHLSSETSSIFQRILKLIETIEKDSEAIVQFHASLIEKKQVQSVQSGGHKNRANTHRRSKKGKPNRKSLNHRPKSKFSNAGGSAQQCEGLPNPHLDTVELSDAMGSLQLSDCEVSSSSSSLLDLLDDGKHEDKSHLLPSANDNPNNPVIIPKHKTFTPHLKLKVDVRNEEQNAKVVDFLLRLSDTTTQKIKLSDLENFVAKLRGELKCTGSGSKHYMLSIPRVNGNAMAFFNIQHKPGESGRFITMIAIRIIRGELARVNLFSEYGIQRDDFPQSSTSRKHSRQP